MCYTDKYCGVWVFIWIHINIVRFWERTTKPLSKKAIAKGVGVAFIALVGGLLAAVQPVLGGALCVLAFLLGVILLVRGEVEKAVREEQMESIADSVG